MKKITSSFMLLIFIGLSGCGSTSNLQPLDLLMNNNWVLSSLMGKGLDAGKFMNGLPFLNFMDEGKLAGFAGCNNFSGNFSIEGTGLNLDPGGLTKKACEESGEDEFVSALKAASRFKVNRNTLTLMDGTEELMSFIPQK